MTIRNKDGTTFKLEGVNPLMKEQDHWKGEKWHVYHPEEEKIVLLDPKRSFTQDIGDDVENVVTSMLGVGAIQQKEILYCMPLIVSYEEDPLYGQKKRKTDWGDKFSFEAVTIASSTGLTATYFANLPTEKVPEGSVILVFNERQWWKVGGIEIVEGGVHIHCVPTDIKVSF